MHAPLFEPPPYTRSKEFIVARSLPNPAPELHPIKQAKRFLNGVDRHSLVARCG